MRKDPATVRLFFLIFAGSISLLCLVVSAYQLYDFTESTAFCGTVCHTVMYPEYTTYKASPHSNVKCSSCHVGPGANYLIKSKIAGIPMILGTLTGTYPKPIESPLDNLRPARETCAECHRPQLFSGDLLIQKSNFASDENNTETTTTRYLDLGGGDRSTARGIHWHITTDMFYLPLDSKRTQIGWVQSKDENGNVITYTDPDKTGQLTQENLEDKQRLMDCVDCHNRATHIFSSPDELLDKALAEGKIDKTLPFVKSQALDILDPPSSSLEAAETKIESIKEFYRTSYPAVFSSKQAQIDQLMVQMREVARLTTFPFMKVDYNTHYDFSDHRDGLGCFRCHGKLVVSSGPSSGQLLSANCNLCHTTLDPTTVPLGAIPHDLTGREDCLSCHGLNSTVKPFPAEHQGYQVDACINCHEPFAVSAKVMPHPVENMGDCISCHGTTAILPFPVDHEGRTNVSCTACHKPTANGVPQIPHKIEGRGDCLSCHGSTGTRPNPANHAGLDNNICTSCHSPSTKLSPNIPHQIKNITNCLDCHGTGGIVPFPGDHSGYTYPNCLTCHDSVPNAAPYILHKTAGYEGCLSCHEADGVSPFPASHSRRTNNTCAMCHSAIPGAFPGIVHKTAGWEDCNSCHALSSFSPAPASHTNWTNDICAVCHSVRAAEARSIPHLVDANTGPCSNCHGPVAFSPAPVTHANWPDTSCTLCHTAVPEPATGIRHSLTGLVDCNGCHGIAAINNMPRNHVGWIDSSCTLCHSATQIITPIIPHQIAGIGSNCTTCHLTGLIAIPSNHLGLNANSCLRCHLANPQSAPVIPHVSTGLGIDCLSCHTGLFSPPASHSTFNNSYCQLCHAAVVNPAPAILHTLTGRSDCFSCHTAGGVPIPVSHNNYSLNFCFLCHTTAAQVQAPVAPSGLTTAPAANQISLTWNDNSNNESGFHISRALNSAFTTGLAAFTVGANITTYNDTSIQPGVSYYYRVTAFNSAGDSSVSNTSNVTAGGTVTVPAAPSALTSSAGSGLINLTWTDNSANEAGFNIQRATNSGFTSGLTTFTVGVGASTYTDSTVAGGTTYYYRVRAFNNAGQSSFSNTSSATAVGTVTVPVAPTALTASATFTQINLAWTDNSANEAGFHIQRATNSGFTAGLTTTTVGINITTFADTSAVTGTTYFFRVTAFNSAGDSSPSNSVSAARTPALNGQAIFSANCTGCHGVSTALATGMTQSQLVTWIPGHNNGASLSPAEVAAVAAYIKP